MNPSAEPLSPRKLVLVPVPRHGLKLRFEFNRVGPSYFVLKPPLRLEDQGLGFRVWGLRLSGWAFKCRVSGLGLRA